MQRKTTASARLGVHGRLDPGPFAAGTFSTKVERCDLKTASGIPPWGLPPPTLLWAQRSVRAVPACLIAFTGDMLANFAMALFEQQFEDCKRDPSLEAPPPIRYCGRNGPFELSLTA